MYSKFYNALSNEIFQEICQGDEKKFFVCVAHVFMLQIFHISLNARARDIKQSALQTHSRDKIILFLTI